MKTNQILCVKLCGGEIEIEHLTYYGDLTQLFHLGNRLRMDEGKQPLQLQSFLNSKSVREHCDYLKSDCLFNVSEKGAFYKEGRGAATRTKAHLMILVLAAQALSSKFHYEFNKLVVLDKLLEYRDKSGDSFKSLNVVIDAKVPGTISKYRYIQLAKAIKTRVNPDNDWNHASAEQLRLRATIEDTLITLMMLDRIKDIDDACSLVDKIVK